MRDLARSLRLTGRPVPVPWRGLGRWVKPRGQNLMLVLAAGGVGKSAFALEWALSLGHPCLYVSLDTSLVDHGVRILARDTGLRVEDIQEGHDDDPDDWSATWGDVLSELDYPARFCDIAQTAREVDELVAAETEYWGDAPLLVIVDNLGNLLEKDEGAAEYRRVLRELHMRVAKKHDTLVVALHHLRKLPPKQSRKDEDDEDLEQGTKPVKLSDALYESDKEAQYVLGLWRPEPKRMAVGVLKNRMGPASRTGRLHTTLDADLAHMRIESPVVPYEHWNTTPQVV